MKVAIVTAVVGACLAFAGATWAYIPLVQTEAKATLSAAEFGQAFAGAVNAHGGGRSIVHVDCVQGDPGDYMCSYAVRRRTGPLECHLMQGTWSSETGEITVTLAGRTRRCATLRDAVHSLD